MTYIDKLLAGAVCALIGTLLLKVGQPLLALAFFAPALWMFVYAILDLRRSRL